MVVNTHNGLLGTDVASATSNAEFPLDSTSRISFNENDNDQMSQPPEMQINKENSAPPSTSMAPDGGLKPWLAVAGGFCGFFVSFGWINCIGVFQDYYQTHQLVDLSPSTVAWIASLETFMMLVGAPICGRVFDSYGPRWLLLGGTCFHVFGLMMTSLSSKYYQFILAQGICSPLGACAIFFASTASVTTWFHHRRALALGVTVSGSSLGGVIFPIMVDRLVPEVGFGWAMRICAFLIIFLLIISNLTVRSRLSHQPKRTDIMDLIRPLGEVPFLLTVIAAFLFFWGMFLPFNFIILQAERYGMSAQLAAYLVPILNAASILGRLLPGYLADRLGRFNTMIFMSYFSAILVLALWIPSHANATVLIFAALYGFSSGAFIGLGPAVVAQISEVREIGVRTGTFYAISSIAALTGNPIGGALVPDVLHGTFWKLQVFSGAVMLAGSTFFLMARVYLAGLKLNKKV